MENMEQEGPWETMRAEQENGELLSEDERMEASKEFREEEPQGSVKEGTKYFLTALPVHCVNK